MKFLMILIEGVLLCIITLCFFSFAAGLLLHPLLQACDDFPRAVDFNSGLAMIQKHL
jgi:hypothetical protein